jgi:hypothetical protein
MNTLQISKKRPAIMAKPGRRSVAASSVPVIPNCTRVSRCPALMATA